MASRSEVVLEFVGDDSRLVNTLRNVERETGSVLGVIGKLGKVGAGASGFVGMANGAMTLGSALTTLAPAALALPGILLGGAVAMQTFKLATAGFSDAVSGDAEALAKFSPAGQAAVKAVQGLGTGFKAMRSAVQESFFAGLAPQIKTVGGNLLKLGTAELPKVAAGFNGMAKEALGAANTPFFKEDLSAIIGDTAGMLDRMRFSAASVLSGFVGLGAVGSKYLPAIGGAIDSVAGKFSRWVNSGIESGAIDGMIDRALAGFRTLGQIISTVAQTAMSVGSAINAGLGAGATPLDMLLEKVRAFQAALSTPEAQAALTQLGTAIRAVSDAFTAVLPHVIQFAAQIGSMLLPAITGIANVIAANGGLFAGLIVGVAGAVVAVRSILGVITLVRGALAAWQAVQAVFTSQLLASWASAAAGAVAAIGRMIVQGALWVASTIAQGAMALASLAATAAGYVAQWVLMAVQSLARAAMMAASWLIAMGPIGWVIAAVVALVALVIANWDTVSAATSAAWSAVTGWISGAWNTITSVVSSAAAAVLNFISNAWNTAGAVVQAAWQAHVQWVASGVAQVLGYVQSLPGRIMSFLGNIGNLLVSSGRALIDGFWNGIKSTWNSLVSWFRGQLAWFRGLWPFSPAKWGPFSGRGYVTYSGEALVGDFAKSLKSGLPAVGQAASQVMSAAQDPFASMADVVRWGDVSEDTWYKMRAAGWKGRAGDGMEALYRPTGTSSGGGGVQVSFVGNTSDALATVIMQLIRTGKIQIARA